ncbi:MAG TPA: glycosyltransferase family 4 protein [Ilumatobacter sp.]
MSDDLLASAVDRLRGLGITRVETYAWRDLDDPDAGGSEVHADEIMRRWAAAGLEVVHRTSTAAAPRAFERHGYRVVQRGGRMGVFARVVVRQLLRRRPAGTATVEIWNGMPWFGPLWAPRRRVVWLHHVHRDMWAAALPGPLAAVGRALECRIAPPLYRRSPIVTLSESSAAGILELGIPAAALVIIPPGVHERFVPAPEQRCDRPVVVIVGRLAPVKRHVEVLESLLAARPAMSPLEVRIVGDGPTRGSIERWVADHDAHEWVTLLGRLGDDALVAEYQRAWMVVSGSHAEGWGMSLTEGAACGTPSVATDIAGHREAAVDGVTGLLVPGVGDLGAAVARLVGDEALRRRLADGAVEHAERLSWNAVAARHLVVLADAVGRRRVSEP